MRYIFFSTPAFSHINSFAPVIECLTKRGDEVYFVTSKKYKNFADKTKSIFVEYPAEFTNVSFAIECNNLVYIYEKILLSYDHLIKFSQDLILNIRPDCIIHDSMVGFAKIAGNKLKVPTVNAITTLALNVFVMSSNPRVIIWGLKSFLKSPLKTCRLLKLGRQIKKSYSTKRNPLFDVFLSEEKLNIVLTPKNVQSFSTTFNNTFFFARPTIYERIGETIKICKNKPLIYVALGTTISSESVIEGLIDILKNKDVDVIIAGINSNKQYKNITFTKFVNQLEVLQKTTLFINHGGLNSIYEAIWFKVPQICVPLCLEQAVNAKIVEKNNCGFVCHKFSKTKISGFINNILNAKVKLDFKISENFYRAPRVECILQKIDRFLEVGND